MANVLIIGNGGREDALAWKLKQSTSVAKIFVFPGNAGTLLAGSKISKADIPTKDDQSIVAWACKNHINLSIIGPEAYLANGLADLFEQNNIPCFGPSKLAAEIECSKAFSKALMHENNIATARWQSFTDSKLACQYISQAPFKAWVVKASGLAGGKGVVVAGSTEEACKVAVNMLENKAFGDAGNTIVVEELLEGEEISCLGFCDGTQVVMMPPCQDHKRVGEGDQGPNTGGMGAFCPVSKVDAGTLEEIRVGVLQRTVDALKSMDRPFIGVLYAGMMLTQDGPKVLEFNCRFGDPETQVLMPLLNCDLYKVMEACVRGRLQEVQVEFSKGSALGIVLASEGYPGPLTKMGVPISNLDRLSELGKAGSSCIIFHSGTALDAKNKVITNGGRVLTVVCKANNLEESCEGSKLGASLVQFDGKHFRGDIGWRSLQRKAGVTYKDAGVDIEEADLFIENIKPIVAKTKNQGCAGSDLGSFGAIFDPFPYFFTHHSLISATCGVGSKIKLSMQHKRYQDIGIDLVASCTNEVLSQGGVPLFFLDYFATGKLQSHVACDLVKGMAISCKETGCALVGGETAEMPDVYQPNDFDLAGFVLAAVDNHLFTSSPAVGDVLIGLKSSGLHTHGHNLVPQPHLFLEEMLAPTTAYTPHLLPLMRKGLIKRCAHVGEGGWTAALHKIMHLCSPLMPIINQSSWSLPKIFEAVLQQTDKDTLYSNFNCGFGMLLVVAPTDVDQVMRRLGELPVVMGSVGLNEVECCLPSSPVSSKHDTLLKRILDQSHLITKLDLFGGAYKDPLLVSGTDGVGTKIKVAQALQDYRTIGIDLVAMCVNDLICQGAETLTFSTYVASSDTDESLLTQLLQGVKQGCKLAGCFLGEFKVADVPEIYQSGEVDLAGFAVGVVERKCLLPQRSICHGDLLIGLMSSGLHSNGYSLARKVVQQADLTRDSPIGRCMLTPTTIYVPFLLPLIRKGLIKACANITGGGIPGNLCRVLPKSSSSSSSSLVAHVNAMKWVIPAIFTHVQQQGRVSDEEMLKTFNCGLGMVLVVDPEHALHVMEELKRGKVEAHEVGRVLKQKNATHKVVVSNLAKSLHRSNNKARVAVLISGSGTNLQSLIDDSFKADSPYQIVLVVSNKADAYGLERANKARIPTLVIKHKDYPSRETFDDVIHQNLTSNNVQVVCLAGFMRILSSKLVERWQGRMLNIHPSLLPSFKGLHVHRQVLDAGVTLSGCTVHFVSNELDAGAIIAQKSVHVLPDDNEESLAERVKTVEHVTYPKAVRLLVEGRVELVGGTKVQWKL